MIHKYAAWTRRSASTTKCSPALVVLGLIATVAITCYIYRQVIFETVLAAVAALVIVAAAGACIAIAVNTRRYLRAQRVIALEREPVPDTWTKAASRPVDEHETTDAEAKAISDEADWLASGVELAFSPDGKTLKTKAKAKP